MITPVYIKMDAVDQLLLSEGVCNQLEIVKYDARVKPGSAVLTSEADDPPKESGEEKKAFVPMVRVKLLHSLNLPPNQKVVADVQLSNGYSKADSLLLEGNTSLCESMGVQVEDALVRPSQDGRAKVSVWNPLVSRRLLVKESS